MLGELDYYLQKDESRPPTYTINGNKFKMDKGLNISHGTIKILEENIGSKIPDILHSNIFANVSPRARETGKNKQMRLQQIK